MVLLLMSRRALENFFSQILNNSHENLFLLSGYYSSFSLTFYEMLEFIFDLLIFSLFYIYYTWCCLSFFSYSSYSFIEVSSAPFFISLIYVILSSSTRFFSFFTIRIFYILFFLLFLFFLLLYDCRQSFLLLCLFESSPVHYLLLALFYGCFSPHDCVFLFSAVMYIPYFFLLFLSLCLFQLLQK